jgi:hypothetical protein
VAADRAALLLLLLRCWGPPRELDSGRPKRLCDGEALRPAEGGREGERGCPRPSAATEDDDNANGDDGGGRVVSADGDLPMAAREGRFFVPGLPLLPPEEAAARRCFANLIAAKRFSSVGVETEVLIYSEGAGTLPLARSRGYPHRSLRLISTRGVAKVNFLSITQNGRRMCA